jgi:hypothetical protein
MEEKKQGLGQKLKGIFAKRNSAPSVAPVVLSSVHFQTWDVSLVVRCSSSRAGLFVLRCLAFLFFFVFFLFFVYFFFCSS